MNRATVRLMLAVLLTAAAAGCGGSLDGREITWRNGDVELVGTLVVPDGEGPHPLAVFVGGSGCVPRSHRMTREHASELAARGLAVFAYDKRGCGESGGDWRDVPLEPLADDLLAVLPQLVADPRINADRIGLMGVSQGAWVSLIAAEKSSRFSFIVMLSGPPMTPAEQAHAIVELALEAKGWDPRSIADAVALDRVVAEVYRTDSGWEAARLAVEEASNEPWFEDAPVGIQSRDSWNWRWYATLMDHDPLPSLSGLGIPILAVYGELDMIVPARRSQRIVEELAPSARGPREVVMLPGVGHELRPGKGESWPDEHWDILASWLTRYDILAAR